MRDTLTLPVEVLLHTALPAVPATTTEEGVSEEPVQAPPAYTPLIFRAVDSSTYACPCALPVHAPRGTLLHVMPGGPEQPPCWKPASEKVPSAFKEVTDREPVEVVKQPPIIPTSPLMSDCGPEPGGRYVEHKESEYTPITEICGLGPPPPPPSPPSPPPPSPLPPPSLPPLVGDAAGVGNGVLEGVGEGAEPQTEPTLAQVPAGRESVL